MATETTDVVIVGAGAAGGIIAAELAKAGMQVIALERGPRLKTSDFAGQDELRYFQRQDTRPDTKRQPVTWRPNSNTTATPFGVLNYGNQAGGGTVHYGAVSWRMHEDDFRARSQTIERYGPDSIPEDALSVGDRVRVAGHPARRAGNTMFVLHALFPNGQEIVFDPWGEPRWGEGIGTTDVWQATRDDAQAQDDGIFRVWTTSLSDPNAFPFPEAFDPSLVSRYPLTEEALASLATFDPLVDIPTLNCAAKGMPTIMEQPYPMEIVDQGDSILMRIEEYDTLRTIHMDQTDVPAGQPHSNLGYSIGHWEGETLVVTTTRVNWPFLYSVGVPQSEAVEIVERLTPSADGSRLDLVMTITDPATFTAPVEVGKTWLALPGIQVEPYECEI